MNARERGLALSREAGADIALDAREGKDLLNKHASSPMEGV